MHKSFSSNWFSPLSCLTMKNPYLFSGLLIRARFVNTTSSSSEVAPCCGVSSFCKRLTPSSTLFCSWGLTITCREGRIRNCVSSSSSSSSMSTSSAWPLGTWAIFSELATQTYPSSFVDVWKSPAFKSFAFVLARADWWNASCWKNWL